MPSEDSQDAQLTGLSRSVPNLCSLEDLARAVQACQAHQRSLADRGILPTADPSALAWLLQVQVPSKSLAIAIFDRATRGWYLECYQPSEDPFAGQQTPFFRGNAEQLQDPALHPEQLNIVLSQILQACSEGQGLEIELVLDPEGRWHCVQAKPLGASPSAKHQSFLEAAQAQLAAVGQTLREQARLELDAEHNPEPLSPAHIWLMSALNPKGQAPSYLVLCGWLYEIRSPSGPSAQASVDPAKATGTSALAATLGRLATELIPRAQKHLTSFEEQWPQLNRSDIDTMLQDALDRCQRILSDRQRWVAKLRVHKPEQKIREDFSFSATLSNKASFADVLPTRWDICAPSLNSASLPAAKDPSENNHDLPQDEPTQWDLLDEWDDHLFALALELVRRAWIKIAAVAEIPPELIFFADRDALGAFCLGKLDAAELLELCHQGKRVHQQQCELDAPRLLLQGRPAPMSRDSRVHGLGIGASLYATLHKRRDLQELLANPPPPRTSILAIPALTAPAALALHRLQIRAVVTQYGGLASHGARMATELGISAIIGCDACMELPEGASVWLDTRRGRLWWIHDA